MSRTTIQLDAKNEDWLTNKNRKELAKKRAAIAESKFDEQSKSSKSREVQALQDARLVHNVVVRALLMKNSGMD